MEKTKLRNLLKELHGELENAELAESIDRESHKLLRNVMDDIHNVLDRAEPRSREESQSISDQLNRAVVDFENSHPQVSFAARRLLKTLTDIGI